MNNLARTSTVSVISPQKSFRASDPVWGWTGDDYDLSATLTCGQSFCWRQGAGEKWEGWIGQTFCIAQQNGAPISISGVGLSSSQVENYFQVGCDIRKIRNTFPKDPWMSQALRYAGGMRLLKQDPWETTANFICSAMKRVPHIMAMNEALRHALGEEIAPGRFAYPSASVIAGASEIQLRDCKLGFRAPHLLKAAQQITSGEVDLNSLFKISTEEARQELLKLQGVGEKVANCILLFAYGRTEAFPIDVWVDRILRKLYFKGKRKVTVARMKSFSADYFGPHAGYAQQYLFHWMRNLPSMELKKILSS